jgi:hypothetical protein
MIAHFPLDILCEGSVSGGQPARKPRTECACQPVVSMMAAMVAPLGRLNSPSNAACMDLLRL